MATVLFRVELPVLLPTATTNANNNTTSDGLVRSMANFTLLSLLGDQLHGLDRARLVCLSEKNLQPCSKGQLKLFNDCSLLLLNSL